MEPPSLKLWKRCRWLAPWQNLIDLLFPPICVVCGRARVWQLAVCPRCWASLPYTGDLSYRGNLMEEHLGSYPSLVRAGAWLLYRKGSAYRSLLQAIKYQDDKELAEELGRELVKVHRCSGFFDSVDAVLPIPLHPRKQKARGYNQSEWLAKGLAEQLHLPIWTDVWERCRNTDTQTRKSAAERKRNMQGAFKLLDGERLRAKHLLLVDDVFTTGATIESAIEALRSVEGIQVSVFTLARAE